MAGDKHTAVFLDRDGIVNKVIMRDGKPGSPRTIDEFEWEDGAAESIKKLKDHGIPVVVVSNQPDVARGRIDQETLDTMTMKVYSETNVDDVLICPHDDIDGCRCRKPKPGMLVEAAKKWGVDCTRSFLIGDGWKDAGAGAAAGCTTILLNRKYNQGVECDYRVKDLKEAVNFIVKREVVKR